MKIFYSILIFIMALFIIGEFFYLRNTSRNLSPPRQIGEDPSSLPLINQQNNKTLKNSSGSVLGKLKNQKEVIVPILNYHYIRQLPNPDQDPLGVSLSVSPEMFDQQLAWLKEKEYSFITLNELQNTLNNNDELPNLPVILTFDDGYQDFYTNAYPILTKYQARAEVFVITARLDEKDELYLKTSQIQEMDKSGLITIGSHTVTHSNVTSEKTDLYKELVKSKKVIETKLGHKIYDFAYPSGHYSELAIKGVKNAGYQTAVTTQEGSAHHAMDLLTLSRVRISGKISIEQFKIKLKEASKPRYGDEVESRK